MAKYTLAQINAELARRASQSVAPAQKYTLAQINAELARRGVGSTTATSQPSSPMSDALTTSSPILGLLAKYPQLAFGAEKGVADLGSDVGDLLIRGANYLTGSKIAPNPQVKGLPGSQPSSTAFKIGDIAGQIGPTLAIPGAGETAGARILSNILSGAGLGAVSAAGDPKSNLGKAALSGGLTGGALGAAGEGLTSISPALRAALTKFAGKKVRSPEAIKTLSDKIGADVPVNLFDLMGNTRLGGKSADILRASPVSGIRTPEQSLLSAYDTAGNNLATDLLGNVNPDELSQNVLNSIKTHYTNNNEIAKGLYAKVDDLANKENLLSPLSNTVGKINELKSIIGNKALKDSGNPILDKIISNLSLDSSSGPVDLKYITETNKDLGDIANSEYSAGNKTVATRAGQLKSALEKDYSDAAKAGSSEIKQLYDEAKSYFANNVAPFKDTSIWSMINGNKDTSSIATDLIKNKDDMRSILDILSPDEKNKVGALLLKRHIQIGPDGEVMTNTSPMLNAYNNLSSRVKNSLFTDEQRAQLDHANALKSVVRDASIQEKKPFTGGKNAEKLTRYAAGGLLGYTWMNDPHAAVALAALMGAGSRVGKKALYGPALRRVITGGDLMSPTSQANIRLLAKILGRTSAQQENE